MIDGYRRFLGDCVETDSIYKRICADLDGIETAHDLRALALKWLNVIFQTGACQP